MALFSTGSLWYDERLGSWCLQQDRRLAGLWLVAAVLAIVVFWVATGPFQWGLHGLILAVAAVATVALQRSDDQSFVLVLDSEGLGLAGRRVPWPRVTGARAERVVYLSVLKQPQGEMSALVLDLDGESRGFATRAPLEQVEQLAAELRDRAGSG